MKQTKQKPKIQTSKKNNSFSFVSICITAIILLVILLFTVFAYGTELTNVKNFCADSNMTYGVYHNMRVCYSQSDNLTSVIEIIPSGNEYGFGRGWFNFTI